MMCRDGVLLILLVVPVLLTGCGEAESDGYREISTPIGDLAATAVSDTQGTEGSADGMSTDPVAAREASPAAESSGGSESDGGVVSEEAGRTPSMSGGSNPAPGRDTGKETGDPAGSTGEVPAVGEDEASGVVAAPSGASSKEKRPREIKLLVPHKTFPVEGPEGAVRVSFDDVDLLKVLNMDPVVPEAPKLMPDWLKALDGKRVRIRGFMIPPFSETNVRAFTLARDTELCCFGRNPLPYDLIDVFLRKGAETDYIDLRPFDVVGTFHIGDEIEPGYLYSIDDAIVIQ